MLALASRGEGGGSPLHQFRCHPEGASADRLRPKDLVLAELFLGQRGAGEVVCNAPKNKIYMKMKNHCVLSKLHSDFVYVDFNKC